MSEPPSQKFPDNARLPGRRGLLFVAGSWLFQGVLFGGLGLRYQGAFALLAAGGILLVVRFVSRREVAYHLVGVITLLSLILGALSTRWSPPNSLWILAQIPLFAAYLLSLQGALFWSALSLGAVLFLRLVPLDFFPWKEGSLLAHEALVTQISLGGLLFVLARYVRKSETLAWEQINQQSVAIEEHQRQLVAREHERATQEQEQRKTREEAMRAVRAKDTFFANMSHELRTPLNAIVGLSALLADSELDENQRENVELISKSSRALLDLIGDILDMSKMEAGQLVPESRPFSLPACVEDATDIVAVQAQQKGLALLVDILPDVPSEIVSDLARLRQILVNLLGNAVKFTRQGRVLVRVSVAHADGEECGLRFDVQDTGIGIPRDKHALLFKPFSQINSSISQEYGGTGLGLAISRALAELMGGRMWVESVEGKGSTFSFTISARGNGARQTKPALGKRVLVLLKDEDERAGSCHLAQGLGATS